ncbi:MAG: hypothetical protein ACXV9R_13070 [Methylobacter sp.]
MMSYLVNENKAKLLADQIEEAEWQVLKRQQVVDIQTTTLVQKIYRQLTDPASLLLAGGIGFILGEMTKPQAPKPIGASAKDKTAAAATSPLKVALNLMTSAQTLYTALPLAWLMKSRYRRLDARPGVVKQEQQPPVSVSGATWDRRKSRS